MTGFVRSSLGGAAPADTLHDQQHYLNSGLVPVDCERCGARTLARKNSELQTSIQWLVPARKVCPVLAEAAAEGRQPGCVDTCPWLRDSIREAVRSGRLQVTEIA